MTGLIYHFTGISAAAIMIQFNEYSLGGSGSELNLDTREDNRLATLEMIRQARLRVDIVSRDLDPAIYDQPALIDVFKNMILENRRARVRIIVFDAQALARRGHQLLKLAGDLSSFIEIRQGSREHEQYSEAMLVADECGYIHRLLWNRYEANANFNDRHQCKLLLNIFENMWDHATSSVYLRRLSI